MLTPYTSGMDLAAMACAALATLFTLAVPATFIGLAGASANDDDTAYRRARSGVTATGFLWLAGLVAASVVALTNAGYAWLDKWLGAAASLLIPRNDAVTYAVLGLVVLLANVIVRYTRPYLEGQEKQRHFLRWLLATLGAVSVIVVTNDLLLLAFAWIATSLSLHQLLTFFRDRPMALMAAHKKFIISRIADASFVIAIALIGIEVGSFRIDDLHAWALATQTMPTSAVVAAVLVAVGACLKCAQLPFHGWLIQVMEAPTPVSALLHAGVVNLGGFLMIRLSPWMVQMEAAQTLLVVVGCTSAVVASLVMMTRASIKVQLAWSTCAQMGFMLVQCGLGAYELALLHLVAHSLYKAHAFLGSGGVVDTWRETSVTPSQPRPSSWSWVLAAVCGAAVVSLGARLVGFDPQTQPTLWVFGGILSLALVPWLVRANQSSSRGTLTAGIGVALLTGLYFAGHALFALIVVPTTVATVPVTRLVVVSVGFVALFLCTVSLLARPFGAFARWAYPLLHGGLFLDEAFTRLTFRLWPPRLPPRPVPSASPVTTPTVEQQS